MKIDRAIIRIKEFILSEEGEITEWLVGAVILGIGSIPIIVGIANSLLQVSGNAEEHIQSIISTGY